MKILIVDDHPVLREGLVTLFRHGTAEATVLQAGTVADALRLVADHPDVDLVVLDLVMPTDDGLAAIGKIGRARPDLPVIVYSSSEDPNDARQALSAGALGYVPKSAAPNALLSAVDIVLNGDLYVPPLILNQTPRRSAFGSLGRLGDVVLTPRQIDVLKLLTEGHPNKAIANQLNMSEKTVKAHVTAIFKALQVVNRTQAASAAQSAGLI